MLVRDNYREETREEDSGQLVDRFVRKSPAYIFHFENGCDERFFSLSSIRKFAWKDNKKKVPRSIPFSYSKIKNTHMTSCD